LRIHAVGIFASLGNVPFARLNLATRLLNIPEILYFYIKTFIFPFYSPASYNWFYTKIDYSHFIFPLIIDLLFFATIIISAIFIFKKSSRKSFLLYLFFTIWFLFGLLFHLQVFPLDQTVAGRWFYFPLIGILGMIGILIETFHVNLKNRWIITVIVLALFSLSLTTIKQSVKFHDDETLTNLDLVTSKYQTDYNVEYLISEMYYATGRFNDARIHAQKSVQLFPTITNYTNLGAIYSRMGNYLQAKNSYLKALQYGDDSLPYENLSSLAMISKNINDISFIKNVSLKKYPHDGIIWFNLAILEYSLEKVNDAKQSINMAAQYYKNPDLKFIEYIITNNKQLNIAVKNGSVTFYTY
jgi:hypothetical protein